MVYVTSKSHMFVYGLCHMLEVMLMSMNYAVTGGRIDLCLWSVLPMKAMSGSVVLLLSRACVDIHG